MSQRSALLKIFHRLNECYGQQHWWPADSPFEVIVGAILTQNTSWNNVEKAIRVLKKKIQKDGLMRELRQRQYYEKPTLKRQRKLKESLRRVAKENRLREKYL